MLAHFEHFLTKKGARKGGGAKVYFFHDFHEKSVLFDQKRSAPRSYVKSQLWDFHGILAAETDQGPVMDLMEVDVPRLNVGATRKIFLKKIFHLFVAVVSFIFQFFFFDFFEKSAKNRGDAKGVNIFSTVTA